jgi:hypothetical protein
MEVMVFTKDGLKPRKDLVVKDIIQEHENARVIVTQWFLGEELVRQDVYANMLRQPQMQAEQGNLGG